MVEVFKCQVLFGVVHELSVAYITNVLCYWSVWI